MEKFTRHIVNMMKAEKLYETQGGPIILSQVVKKHTHFMFVTTSFSNDI